MKKIIISILLIGIISFANGQESNSQGFDPKGNFFTGGNLGLAFGTITNVDLAPAFGYYANKYVSFGLGGIYQYYGSRQLGYSVNIWGGRGFVRIHPFTKFFVHGEYEMLTYKTDMYSQTREVESILSENLLAGIGYTEHLSEKFSSYIMVLYNFNQTYQTPYSNPVFRVGLEYRFPAKKQKKTNQSF